MLIDTHCHLQFKAYQENQEEVIRRALEAGVFMITVGTKKRISEAGVALAEKYDGVWAAVGLHPAHLFPYPLDDEEGTVPKPEEFDINVYRSLAKHSKVVAIGECGLDYFRIKEKNNAVEIREKQEKTFRGHLDLADELDLPVIIHCREAHTESLRILKEYIEAGRLRRRGVTHCFTGTKAEAADYLSLGFFIGFTGVITFPPKKNQKEDLAEVVRTVPLDRLLIETDAPLLAPIPHRGKQNEPAFVKYVAQKVAELKQISFDEVAETTTKNAKILFDF